ncbi:hypothetical protein CKO38_11925 [Rhodospirillum rubrum]|uniref:flagellar hook protein FlgE n=1 Tax=Rhodospirillum rubrum TaxID=1085 RepID=UPI0019087E46|nr:flagellar hook-basal body complex protein [Rhodospirillum rubrum]MBK1665443.1 hypothetical protein [Rhodospirillum rubrum]MBK1677362.1 hypothetical protein [Rhodospirillum rubrum]
MSLYGALFSGVSGLQAQSSALGAIADNVTNVNTVGYKGTKVNFQTLVTQQVSLTAYSPGGVQSKPRTGVDVQGLLQATTSSTDIGISGQGFFVVSGQAIDPTGYAYSRAGSFKVDKDGYLMNSGGYYMQGWPLDNWDGTAAASTVTKNGNVYMKSYKTGSGDTYYINPNAVDNTNMRPINLNTIGGTARATSTLSIGANLPSAADIGSTSKTNALIFDSLGTPHNMNYTWTKRAQNVWDAEITPPEGARQVDMLSQNGETYFAAGRLDFTSVPDAGTSMTINMSGTAYTFNFVAGADSASTTLAAAGAASPFDISVAGRTLSQVLDKLGDAVENASRNAYAAEYGSADGLVETVTGKTFPTRWAERVSGENAILFRQGSESDTMTVDTSLLVTGSQPAVIQTNPIDSAGSPQPWTVRQLSAPSTAVVPMSAADWRGSWVNSNNLNASARDYPSAMTFNGDGTPDTMFGYDEIGADEPRSEVRLDWGNGALNMDGSSAPPGSPAISQFWGNYNSGDGITQRDSAYQLNYISQNGNKFGNYAGVSIGEDGVVTALFDNGVTTPIFMIPIATFVNPNGMNSLSGNVFQETDNSGLPTVRAAGEASAGTVNQATLEASTVDLGTEFTNMITTQRAYSAAAKIITTADDMLDELIRIKR